MKYRLILHAALFATCISLVLHDVQAARAGALDTLLGTYQAPINQLAVKDNPQAYCNDIIAKNEQKDIGSSGNTSHNASQYNNTGSNSSHSNLNTNNSASSSKESSGGGGVSLMGIGANGQGGSKEASSSKSGYASAQQQANTWDKTSRTSNANSSSQTWDRSQTVNVALGKDCSALMQAYAQIEVAHSKDAAGVQVSEQQEATNREGIKAKQEMAAEQRRQEMLGGLLDWRSQKP
jgi:hypothetical protein